MKILTKRLKEPEKGIVYILYIDIEFEDQVYKVTKIGVTTRDVEARVTEILTSIWKITRVFPRCYVKRFKTVYDPYKLESELLLSTPNKFDVDLRFSGSTECFLLSDEQRDTLVDFYNGRVDAINKQMQP